MGDKITIHNFPKYPSFSKDFRKIKDDLLPHLNSTRNHMITRDFLNGASHKDAGAVFGLSGNRARQIVYKTTREIRQRLGVWPT